MLKYVCACDFFDVLSLQPVINYLPAKENGLGCSLFERYAGVLEAMNSPLFYKLTTQYRMVSMIQLLLIYYTCCLLYSMMKFVSFPLKSFMKEKSKQIHLLKKSSSQLIIFGQVDHIVQLCFVMLKGRKERAIAITKFTRNQRATKSRQ